MDYYLGSYVVAKDLRPIFTIWNPSTVSADKQAHKRRTRRAYRQYLKTGAIKDFNRSQKKITRWDFD